MAKKFFPIEDKASQSGSLKDKYRLDWVEESFDFQGKNSGKKIESEYSNSYLGRSINKKKIKILSIAVGLLILVIFGKLFYLQAIKGEEYRLLAEGNRIRLKAVPSERGIIYDRDGKELVQNVPNFYLTLTPQDLPKNNQEKREEVIERAASAGEMDKEKIKTMVEKYGKYGYASLIIKENLDYESALKLYIDSADLPGITIEKGSKRKYLLGGGDESSGALSMSHLLGYLGKLNESEYEELQNKGYMLFDDIGRSGLEKIYEDDLRGRYGKKKAEVNVSGYEQNILAQDDPIPGKNLILSIDAEAQAEMERLIKKALEKTGKKRAAGIAMDPRDGSILALVSWPSFDSNKFSGGISSQDYEEYIENPDNPLFNRAIGGSYPSGSTAKLVIAAAALQEGIITPAKTFLSVGGLQVDKWFFKDWKAGGHGITNVTKAIAWSVNTFFYYIGGGYQNFEGLGVDRIKKYMEMFGLGQKTDIDLPAENNGFIPDKDWKEKTKNEIWYIGDTYNLSIGQGDLLVTPLQVAVWTSAIANGGFKITPHLVSKIEDSKIKKITDKVYEKKIVGVDQTHIATVKKGMRECVTYGSCGLMRSLPFQSAGKTGTAQWSSVKEDHAWFTSFAPYDNPQIVVTVLVEEGEEGSTVAQPIALDFMKWWGKKYLER